MTLTSVGLQGHAGVFTYANLESVTWNKPSNQTGLFCPVSCFHVLKLTLSVWMENSIIISFDGAYYFSNIYSWGSYIFTSKFLFFAFIWPFSTWIGHGPLWSMESCLGHLRPQHVTHKDTTVVCVREICLFCNRRKWSV